MSQNKITPFSDLCVAVLCLFAFLFVFTFAGALVAQDKADAPDSKPAADAKAGNPTTAEDQDEDEDAEEIEVPQLTIGSKAPAIDIEHWLSDGEGKFTKVSQFQPSKVYVLEFWATWCAPCVASMPHISKLQTEFVDRGVQIIGISNEELDEVKEFLQQENKKAKATFAEITKTYCLTTDPDSSATEEYLGGLQAEGIPFSVIVGKEGLIEWFGHPLEMDKPLAAVVDGTWDREAFKAAQAESEITNEDLKAFEETFSQASELAESGEIEEAMALLDEAVEESESTAIKNMYQSVRHQFTVIFRKGKEAVDAMQALIDEAGSDADELGSLLSMFCSVHTEQAIDDEVLKLIRKTADEAIKEEKESFILQYALGQILHIEGDLDGAIASTENAIKILDDYEPEDFEEEYIDQFADEISDFLDKLKAEKQKPKQKE